MSPRFSLTRPAIVVLTLLAIALGGSVDLWAQTLLAALAGLLIFIAPPRGPIARVPIVIAVLLFLLALAAFLPVTSIGSTPWRHYLADECHIAPLDIRTPQPWLTAQACGLFLLGLVWALYVLQQPWDRDSRLRTAMGLVFGVAILAAVAAAAYVFHFRVPGWIQDQNRGWFPNRNQTADVLALAGIINYALIFDRLRKGHLSGYFLLLSLVPIVIELVISYSRAGILLFFGGIALWHLWPRRGKSHKGASLKWVALSTSLTLILIALFLSYGGATLNRFHETPTNHGAEDFSDFRGAIQLDALRFSTQSPLLGVGLGNFEPLFSFSRLDSINANRAIHPESDWLWITCEMGWFAPLLLFSGVVWWLRRCLPLEIKSGESMRRAFIVGGITFLIHGFVDVSGHRIGSVWVALLLFSMALPKSHTQRPSPWTPLLFRGLALLLLLLSFEWYSSLRGSVFPPTTATVARLKSQMASEHIAMPAMEKTADAALRIAPLDWSLYLKLGYARVFQPDKIQQAQDAFLTARALNPFWIALPVNEGQIWLTANQPDLCLDVWRDGLHRVGPQAAEAFREMVGFAPVHTVQREGLAELALDRNDYLLSILPDSEADEADALLTHLLQVDPNLAKFTPVQRDQLFAAWWTQGDQVRLMEVLKAHPEWDIQTWMYQARFAAKENDFPRACAIMAKWVQPPSLPKNDSTRSVADLQETYENSEDKLTTGIMLLLAQVQAADSAGAITTLNALVKLPQHPRYLDYMLARMQADAQQWQPAWEAWQNYLKP